MSEIVAILQNQWFRDPEGVKRIFARHPEQRRRLLSTYLFMRRERPILFSGPMVRGILADLKNQTRRTRGLERVNEKPGAYEFAGWGPNGAALMRYRGSDFVEPVTCPYGQPIDRLWVRETWAAHFMYDDVPPREAHSHWPDDNYWYRADPEGTPGTHGCPMEGLRGRWRPSIHMPRWASRTTLEITDMRVERVQEITEEDAIAEGVVASEPLTEMDIELMRGTEEGELAKLLGVGFQTSTKFAFFCLWDELNEKRGCGWTANPWVWVLRFQRIEVSHG